MSAPVARASAVTRVGVEVAWRDVPQLMLEMRQWFACESRSEGATVTDVRAEGTR